MKAFLRVAAAQFPVSADIARNARTIEQQMREAASGGAHVIQFPETSLSGYAPTHIESYDTYPWGELERATQSICDVAVSLGIWVILGTMRRVDAALPRNCLHVISDAGEIAGTYDKQRLYRGETSYYSPGDAPLVIELRGFLCGFLICYDNCFPELYETYRAMDVGLLFHSFHNAGNERASSIGDLMRAILIARAADHRMWISASNSSKRYSPLSARIVRPDGTMVRALPHIAGIVMDDYPLAELGWTYDNRAR
jgi:predicted amidohydrolase